MIPAAGSFRDRLDWIRQHVVGRGARIQTPFGPRLVCYADVTATGRHLHLVEAWVRHAVPYYANTHSTVSSTGSLFTRLRENARDLVRRGVRAGEDDVVLFVGAGATAAANKLLGLLGWRIPEPLERSHGLSRVVAQAERPVVFTGPFEHHSNLLPWLESIAEVVEIGLDAAGAVNLGELDARLGEYAGRPVLLGSFNAASNVTGQLCDVRAVARVLHRRRALAVFDYAAAGPYVPIDMHPPAPDERIDALFLSPHKFIGGPEASGVLVAHRSLFRSGTPERPGGGTVDYVGGARREAVDYVSDLVQREEGGTPAIVGDLRAGAAFLVKELLGAEDLLQHELEVARAAIARLARHPRIRVLGPTNLPRLPILALTLTDLHHDFASALLDHLFGIQNRSGCSCAGPYGHVVLGIDAARAARLRRLLHRGLNALKPGWVRVSLPCYLSEEDVEFVLSAVEFVAEHGRAFLQLYSLSWRDGAWRHLDGAPPVAAGVELSRAGLERVEPLAFAPAPEAPLSERELRAERKHYFDEAADLAVRLEARWRAMPPAWNVPTGDEEVDALVGFRYMHAEGL